jgi:hypothetical protein
LVAGDVHNQLVADVDLRRSIAQAIQMQLS